VINEISAGSATTCGDRVAMTLIDVQLAALHFNKRPKDMDSEAFAEMTEYARKKSLVKFLQESAEAQFKKNGGGDEIETHLAYMQLAPQLGLDLSGTEMLYRACSGVSDKDLAVAKSKYDGPSSIIPEIKEWEYFMLSYMLDSPEFEGIEFIKKIKLDVGARNEFDTSHLEVGAADGEPRVKETDAEYLKRLEALTSKVKKATILELRAKLIAAAAARESGDVKMESDGAAVGIIPVAGSSILSCTTDRRGIKEGERARGE
jgi:hypothetical protein